jgi:hypothetical protein
LDVNQAGRFVRQVIKRAPPAKPGGARRCLESEREPGKESATRAELGRTHTDAGAIADLIDLIDCIDDVQPRGQALGAGEAEDAGDAGVYLRVVRQVSLSAKRCTSSKQPLHYFKQSLHRITGPAAPEGSPHRPSVWSGTRPATVAFLSQAGFCPRNTWLC